MALIFHPYALLLEGMLLERGVNFLLYITNVMRTLIYPHVSLGGFQMKLSLKAVLILEITESYGVQQRYHLMIDIFLGTGESVPSYQSVELLHVSIYFLFHEFCYFNHY